MKIGINLLPPDRKEKILRNERFRTVLAWEGIIFSIAMLSFGFILGINYVLDLNLRLALENRGDETTEAKYSTIKYYENKFSEINGKLSKISGVMSDQIRWSGLFAKLNEVIPSEVEISGISTKDYALFLAGRAKTRDDLLSLRDNLAKDDCFSNVNLPLSDLVSREDVVFQIDLEMKENCLKSLWKNK